MGEECSACRSCVDQHEIRSNETHLTGTHIISNNNKNNITKINKNNNKDRIIQPKIIVKQNHNNSQSQNKKSKYNIKRKEGRKSTLDSISFNEQKKSEFEEELRISLCSLKERKNSSGYCSSGGGSFLSDDESSISISNKLFINEISEYLPSKKYKILSKLGSGSFGNVYLAQNRYTKEKVAMKIIKKANKDLLSDGEIKDEIDILKTLEHPDIVRIIESFNTKDSYVLVTEYCEGGEL